MYFDIIFGRLRLINQEIVSQCIPIMNPSNPTLVGLMQYHIENRPAKRGETYRLAKDLGYQLIANCQGVLVAAPVYKDVRYLTVPQTTIDSKSNIQYSQVPQPAFENLKIMLRKWPPEESSLRALFRIRLVRKFWCRNYSQPSSFHTKIS